jgi:hypothetical protein
MDQGIRAGTRATYSCVLLAAASLDCFHAALTWREQVARRYPLAAKVEPYQYGIGGLAYVLKSLDRPTEDVQFSRNISAFAPKSTAGFFGLTSAERRHRQEDQTSTSRLQHGCIGQVAVGNGKHQI